MDDYISREAISEGIKKHYYRNPPNFSYGEGFDRGLDRAQRAILDAPAADVEPVRHGRWECVYDDSTGETNITCSHCKNTRTVNGCFVSSNGKSCYFEDDYCPKCGAKMGDKLYG